MDRNQAWPGEPPSQLASTSTHELFGGGGGNGGGGGGDDGDDGHDHYYGADNDTEPHGAIKKPARRNRNALSCAECRRLKLKCSRIWPCTSCVKRKCAHICPDDVLKEVRPSRNKEVGALQARIRELEVALSSASQSGSNYGGHRTRPHSPTNASSSMHDDNTSYQSYEPYNASGAADTSQQPGIQDVAEVMGTLLLGDDGSSRYLGKSAANALFHEDGSDEDDGSAGSDDDDVASSFSGRFNSAGFPMVSRGLDVEDFQAMLPPIAEAKRLVLAYFTNCAYMFEPVRRDVFDKYLAAAYNFGISDALPLEQLACVFMIIALGVSFDLDAEFRDPRSSKYHNIAQACLTSAKFLNVPSLASIQALHLMSTWQLTTHSQTGAFRAWPLLGLAGRMVLSTGIHRDGSIWAIPDPHLTIRRQLFWELASYDRFQGLILGRPYMLNSKHFDTLMPENPTENSGESIEYHRAKWQFSLLVGELCDECLSVGRPGYDTILLHDRKIRTFKENLPSWLRFDSQMEVAEAAPEPGSREFRQMAQRHALVVMIHETLLFLHRVAFANAIENYSSEPLRSPWAQSVVSLCLEAARTLIGVTRSAFSNYPKLAARWWHIQVHCFGAATCLAAVCIKAPASALTRLAWAELCDAVNLLEGQVNEGGHARDLAPRLKRLREQAQLKLDAYQQSIISSNYPGVPASFDLEGTKGSRNAANVSGTSNMTDSPTGEDKASPEDEKLNILGTATRVLEGKLRQAGRNHSHHGTTHRPSPTGSKSVGSSSYHTSVATPTSGSGIGSVGSNSSYGGNPYFGGGSGQAGSRSQSLQMQGTGQSQSAPVSSQSSAVPIFSNSTPTAQSPPFAMGKGAMPVNVGFVDQSLAELLAEVASPTQDPLLSAGSNAADDDSGMMYFTMPGGSDTPNASGSKTVDGNGGGGSSSMNNNHNSILNNNNNTGSFVTGSSYSSYTFAGGDEFKAPRKPTQGAFGSMSQGGGGAGDNRQGAGGGGGASGNSSSLSGPNNNNSQNGVSGVSNNNNSNNSSIGPGSGYTALADTAVSPSSGLNFGMSDYVLGGPGDPSSISNSNASAGGSSFLSSIAGLLAPSPGSGITYAGYSGHLRNKQDGEGGGDSRGGGGGGGGSSNSNSNTNRPSGLNLSSISSTPGEGGRSDTPSDGGGSTTSTANGVNNSNSNGMQTSMEDSYLDTAWMDYFPTPGVGLFPQTTGLLFGNSPVSTPGVQTPNPGRSAIPGSSNLQYSMGVGVGVGGGGPAGMQYQGSMAPQQLQQPPQPQSRFMQQQQQQHPHHQQQQQQQQMQSGQAGPVGAYRMYDDLFGSLNNQF